MEKKCLQFDRTYRQRTFAEAMAGNAGQKYILYPNPNDGNFILQQAVADNEPVVVEIWDAVGRIIYKETHQFAGATSKLQLRNVASGMYLLQLTDRKERTFKFKFVVK